MCASCILNEMSQNKLKKVKKAKPDRKWGYQFFYACGYELPDYNHPGDRKQRLARQAVMVTQRVNYRHGGVGLELYCNAKKRNVRFTMVRRDESFECK